jgi:hypothetical protein
MMVIFQPEKAIRDFQKAVETATEPSQKHLYRSYLYLTNKQYQQAYEGKNNSYKRK